MGLPGLAQAYLQVDMYQLFKSLFHLMQLPTTDKSTAGEMTGLVGG